MKNFKLIIEYEGTRYSGWQIQKNSRTIQGEIVKAIKQIFKNDRFEFHGAGRTDAGVHALNQVAHLKIETSLSPEKIQFSLNDYLPHDITIKAIEKVNKNFHSRKDAISRSYIYQISQRRTALGKRFVWWIKDQLDVEKMIFMNHLFIGKKDFYSFADVDDDEKSTIVKVEDLQIKTEGSLILIRIVASHFLTKMARRIIGVLVEIGRGNLNENQVSIFFEKHTKEPAKFTAPPSGLFLEKVFYSKTEAIPELQSIIRIN